MVANNNSAEYHCAGFNYGFGPWKSANVSDWYGVACEDGHVVALCLVNNSMNGTLVALDLPKLRYLAMIVSPLLTGELPSSYAVTLLSITYTSVFPLLFVKLDLVTPPRKQ